MSQSDSLKIDKDLDSGLKLSRTVAFRVVWRSAVISILLILLGVLVWQGITASGNPPAPNDPASKNISHVSVLVNAGILVFREGLEAVLVLAALTSSLARTDRNYWKPVAIGSGLSFFATIVTYFVVIAILADINANHSANMLNIQAGTGLLAVVVLMVIMNWFFHKIYWTGWITHHNKYYFNRNKYPAIPSPIKAIIIATPPASSQRIGLVFSPACSRRIKVAKRVAAAIFTATPSITSAMPIHTDAD